MVDHGLPDAVIIQPVTALQQPACTEALVRVECVADTSAHHAGLLQFADGQCCWR
jgi:hypothetical protein